MLLDGDLLAQWNPTPSGGGGNYLLLNDLTDSKRVSTLVMSTVDRYSCEDLDAIVGDNFISEIHGYIRQYQRILFGAGWIGWQLSIGVTGDLTRFLNISSSGSSDEFVAYDTPFDVTGLSISPIERRDMTVRLLSIGGAWTFGTGFEAISVIYFEVTYIDVETKKIRGRAAVRIIDGVSHVEEISGRSRIRSITGGSPIPTISGRSRVREI